MTTAFDFRWARQRNAGFRGLSTELVVLVEAEWQQRGHLGIWAPGPAMAAGTRAVATPAALWWLLVLLEHPASMAAAEAVLGERLAAAGVATLDVAVLRADQRQITVLRADQRQITVLLADWVRGLILQAGSATHGIGYDSRHVTGAALAYWFRRVDDGHAAALNRLLRWQGSGLDELDPDLQSVAPRFQLTSW